MSRLLATLAIVLLVAGCSGLGEYVPTRTRHPVAGLGGYAADQVIASPELRAPEGATVLLVAPPQLDPALPVTPEHFREALTRALLAHDGAPQVISWVPERDGQTLDAHQWLLKTRLDAPFGPLRLTDRLLYPYQLTLALYRPGDATPRWQAIIEGAFDSSSLDNP